MAGAVFSSDVHAGEPMNTRPLLFAGLVAAALPAASHAESLRCENGIVAEGDSRLALVYKCGQPALRDDYCAPVYYNRSLDPVPDVVAGAYVPCLYTEEWLYPRGPGEFLAVIRLRGGRVQSITYGREPR
jgi:hypothetical protein